MNTLNQILKSLLVLTMVTLVSCSKGNEEQNEKVNVKISCELKDFPRSIGLKNLIIKIKEINTNKEQVKELSSESAELNLHQGLYSFSISGTSSYIGERGEETFINVEGTLSQVEIKNNVKNEYTVDLYVVGMPEKKMGDFKNLVIKEIFVTGNFDSSGSQYSWDSYFIIHNNSDCVVYADSLFMAESHFLTNNSHSKPKEKNFTSEQFAGRLVMMIPGNGRQYPIAPGGDLIIADQAKNHKELCPESVNLSSAQWEWYEEGKGGRFTDEDNPKVPNMERLFTYSKTFWRPTMQGNIAWAIGKMKKDKDSFIRENIVKIISVTEIPERGIRNEREETCVIIPNDWIADAVQSCPKSQIPTAIQVVSPSLDRGFTFCHMIVRDRDGVGKAIRRKISKTENGIVYYVDTNDSSADFETMVIPSMK